MTRHVKVYYNLRKHCFSVQHKGKVITHLNSLVIRNAKFKVGKAGRARVLRTKQKNVHAFVIGDMETYSDPNVDTERVTYNPYLYSQFVFAADKFAIYATDTAWLSNGRIFVIKRVDG